MPDMAISNLSAKRSGSIVPKVIFTYSIFTPPSACDSVSNASISKPSIWPVAALRMLNTGVSMVVPTRSTLPDRMRSIRSCAAAGRAETMNANARSKERNVIACPRWLNGYQELFRGPAAVEHQRRAGHQRGCAGGEEHNGAGQLVELPEPAELDLGQHLVAERLVLEIRSGHRRFEKRRAEAVDADVVRRQLNRHCLG